MLENTPNQNEPIKSVENQPLPNSLTDYTPKFVNGAGLPGGMRWNDLGLDHVPLVPKEEDKTSPIKSETPSVTKPDSLWGSIRQFLGL